METDVGGGTSPSPSEGGESLTGYSRGRSIISQPYYIKEGRALSKRGEPNEAELRTA